MKWASTASFSFGSFSITVFGVMIENSPKSCSCVLSWSLCAATGAVAADIRSERGWYHCVLARYIMLIVLGMKLE